jgi:hypothetical protein
LQPKYKLQTLAQLPHSTCYSGYSNQETLKSAAIAALFVFVAPFLIRAAKGAESWDSPTKPSNLNFSM